MKLKVKLLDIEAVKPIVVLNEEDAKELGCYPSDRIKISLNGKTVTAIMNTAEKSVAEGEIGIFDEVQNSPTTLTSLKYFHEEANQYHIIAAGSLLGIKVGQESMRCCPLLLQSEIL